VVAGIEETSPSAVADVVDDSVATGKVWLDCLRQGEERDEVELEVVVSSGARRRAGGGDVRCRVRIEREEGKKGGGDVEEE
jgi:hypothetical protein